MNIGVHAILYTPSPLKIVLLKRNASAPTNPGLWSLPGGTVEGAEYALDCLVRELEEECNVKPLELKSFAEWKVNNNMVVFYTSPIDIMKHTCYLSSESDGIGLFDFDEVIRLPICKEHQLAIECWIMLEEQNEYK